ncbi:hypothetical protein QUB05_04630 [Microcoleus sp. F10-C6]|uniref:hypothetical protein n=1 Tax=unclassified Microcoleus TaxID=2642155 RepID=UPI002FD0562B
MTFLAEVPNTYNPAKEYELGFWYSVPKLNGVRCIYINGRPRGLRNQTLKTRYVGLYRLELECRILCETHNLSFLDGELYIPGKTLDQLALLVLDRDNYELAEKNTLEFRVSAVGSVTNPNLTIREMVALMQQNISNPGMISYLPQKLIRNTPLSVLEETNTVMNAGMNEEIILRNPDSIYSGVRSDNLLKVKGITSGIFTVVGFTQSATTGFTSYMSVEGTINGINKTSRVYGLNEEEEQELWMNQTSYLGKQVLIIYMGLTSTGNLRNPALGRFV